MEIKAGRKGKERIGMKGRKEGRMDIKEGRMDAKEGRKERRKDK